jgi:hypothetical protein
LLIGSLFVGLGLASVTRRVDAQSDIEPEDLSTGEISEETLSTDSGADEVSSDDSGSDDSFSTDTDKQGTARSPKPPRLDR